MAYLRVIPRDLFNEANLLKCIGKICLDIHDKTLLNLEFEHDGGAFIVAQNPSDGSISVDNIRFERNDGLFICFHRPLNSRDNWPLMASLLNDDQEYFVFNPSNGTYTEDFKLLLNIDD